MNLTEISTNGLLNGTLLNVRRPWGLSPVDNSYNVLPEETVALIRKICFLGICPFLIVVGVLLNAICLVMFIKLAKTTKSARMILFLTLAISDISYISMEAVSVLFTSSTFYEFPFTEQQQIQAAPYFYSFLRLLPGRFGSLITLFISLERLFCVIQPLKIRQYSTRKNARIAILIAVVMVSILSSPMMLISQTKKIYSNFTGTYLHIIVPTELGKNKELIDIMYIVEETLFSFIPVFGITIACTIIVFVVIRSSRQRTKMTQWMNKKQSNEMSVTKTLLSVIFVFIICKIPVCVLGIIIFINMKPYKYSSNIYEVAMAITYVPLLVNSAVNLIIYYKTSTVYRTEIKKMFRCTHTSTTELITTQQRKITPVPFATGSTVSQTDFWPTYLGKPLRMDRNKAFHIRVMDWFIWYICFCLYMLW